MPWYFLFLTFICEYLLIVRDNYSFFCINRLIIFFVFLCSTAPPAAK
jgi:hypothetical protein